MNTRIQFCYVPNNCLCVATAQSHKDAIPRVDFAKSSSATSAPAELAGSNFVLPTKYNVMTRQNADNGADDIYITPAIVWTVISVVSVHCREEGCIWLYIPNNREIS